MSRTRNRRRKMNPQIEIIEENKDVLAQRGGNKPPLFDINTYALNWEHPNLGKAGLGNEIGIVAYALKFAGSELLKKITFVYLSHITNACFKTITTSAQIIASKFVPRIVKPIVAANSTLSSERFRIDARELLYDTGKMTYNTISELMISSDNNLYIKIQAEAELQGKEAEGNMRRLEDAKKAALERFKSSSQYGTLDAPIENLLKTMNETSAKIERLLNTKVEAAEGVKMTANPADAAAADRSMTLNVRELKGQAALNTHITAVAAGISDAGLLPGGTLPPSPADAQKLLKITRDALQEATVAEQAYQQKHAEALEQMEEAAAQEEAAVTAEEKKNAAKRTAAAKKLEEEAAAAQREAERNRVAFEESERLAQNVVDNTNQTLTDAVNTAQDNAIATPGERAQLDANLEQAFREILPTETARALTEGLPISPVDIPGRVLRVQQGVPHPQDVAPGRGRNAFRQAAQNILSSSQAANAPLQRVTANPFLAEIKGVDALDNLNHIITGQVVPQLPGAAVQCADLPPGFEFLGGGNVQRGGARVQCTPEELQEFKKKLAEKKIALSQNLLDELYQRVYDEVRAAQPSMNHGEAITETDGAAIRKINAWTSEYIAKRAQSAQIIDKSIDDLTATINKVWGNGNSAATEEIYDMYEEWQKQFEKVNTEARGLTENIRMKKLIGLAVFQEAFVRQLVLNESAGVAEAAQQAQALSDATTATTTLTTLGTAAGDHLLRGASSTPLIPYNPKGSPLTLFDLEELSHSKYKIQRYLDERAAYTDTYKKLIRRGTSVEAALKSANDSAKAVRDYWDEKIPRSKFAAFNDSMRGGAVGNNYSIEYAKQIIINSAARNPKTGKIVWNDFIARKFAGELHISKLLTLSKEVSMYTRIGNAFYETVWGIKGLHYVFSLINMVPGMILYIPLFIVGKILQNVFIYLRALTYSQVVRAGAVARLTFWTQQVGARILHGIGVLGQLAGVAGGAIGAFTDIQQLMALSDLKGQIEIVQHSLTEPEFPFINYMPQVHCSILDSTGKSTVSFSSSDSSSEATQVNIIPASTSTICTIATADSGSNVFHAYLASYNIPKGENPKAYNFTAPMGIVVDRLNEFIYVANTGAHTIIRFQAYLYSLVKDKTYGDIAALTSQFGQVIGGMEGEAGFVDSPGIQNPNGSTNAKEGFPISRFNSPVGLEIHPNNQILYICDSGNNMIRQMYIGRTNQATNHFGQTLTIAGTREGGNSDGDNSVAQFKSPQGISMDSDGNYLYVADTGNGIIRVVNCSTGYVHTITPYQESTGMGNVVHKVSTFLSPTDIVCDKNTTLFIVDQAANSVFQMYLAPTSGLANQQMTILGNQHFDTTTGKAAFIDDKLDIQSFYNTVTSPSGYVGIITQIISGVMYKPTGLAIDYNGTYLYITDTLNNLIWQYTILSKTLNIIGGQGANSPCMSDGPNDHSIKCDYLSCPTKDASGNYRNYCGFPIEAGLISKFNNPVGITMSRNNTELYIVESGLATPLETCNPSMSTSTPETNTIGTSFGLNPVPRNVSTPDAAIRLMKLLNPPIPIEFKYYAGGTTTLFSPPILVGYPQTGPTIHSRDGTLFFTIVNYIDLMEINNSCIMVSKSALNMDEVKTVQVAAVGSQSGFGDSIWTLNDDKSKTADNLQVYFNNPQKMVLDFLGNYLYIVDTGNNLIRRVYVGAQVNNPVGCSPNFLHTETVAGTLYTEPTGSDSSTVPPSPSLASNGQGPFYCSVYGNLASFNNPGGIDIDPSGNFLYVADTGNHCIKQIDIRDSGRSDGTINGTTIIVAGQSGEPGYRDTSLIHRGSDNTLTQMNIVMNPDGTYTDSVGRFYPAPTQPYQHGWTTVYNPKNGYGGYNCVEPSYPSFGYISYYGICTDPPNPTVTSTANTTTLFYYPYDLCINLYGNILYVADTGNSLIREVTVGDFTSTSTRGDSIITTNTQPLGITTTLSGTYTPKNYATIIRHAASNFITSDNGFQTNFDVMHQLFGINYNATPSTTSTKTQTGGSSTRKMKIGKIVNTTRRGKKMEKIKGELINSQKGGQNLNLIHQDSAGLHASNPTFMNYTEENIIENIDLSTTNDTVYLPYITKYSIETLKRSPNTVEVSIPVLWGPKRPFNVVSSDAGISDVVSGIQTAEQCRTMGGHLAGHDCYFPHFQSGGAVQSGGVVTPPPLYTHVNTTTYTQFYGELPGIIAYPSFKSDGAPNYTSITNRGNLISERRSRDLTMIQLVIPISNEQWNYLYKTIYGLNISHTTLYSLAGSLDPNINAYKAYGLEHVVFVPDNVAQGQIAAQAAIAEVENERRVNSIFWERGFRGGAPMPIPGTNPSSGSPTTQPVDNIHKFMIGRGYFDDERDPNRLINSNKKWIAQVVYWVRNKILREAYFYPNDPLSLQNAANEVFPDDLGRYAMFFDPLLRSGTTLAPNPYEYKSLNNDTYFNVDDLIGWQRGVCMGFVEGKYLKYNVYYDDFVGFTPADMNPVFLTKVLKSELTQLDWIPILESIKGSNLQNPLSLSSGYISRYSSSSSSSSTTTKKINGTTTNTSDLIEIARAAGADLCKCTYPLDVARAANILDPFLPKEMITDIISKQWQFITETTITNYRENSSIEQHIVNEITYRSINNLYNSSLTTRAAAYADYYDTISVMVANNIPVPPELIVDNNIWILASRAPQLVPDTLMWDWVSGGVSTDVTPLLLGTYSEKVDSNTNPMYASFDGQKYMYKIGNYGGETTDVTVTINSVDPNTPSLPIITGIDTGAGFQRGLETADTPSNYTGEFMPYLGPGYINVATNTQNLVDCSNPSKNIATVLPGFCPPPPYYDSATGLPFSTSSTSSSSSITTLPRTQTTTLPRTQTTTQTQTQTQNSPETHVYNMNYNTFPVAIVDGPTAWWCGKFDTNTIENANNNVLLGAHTPVVYVTVNGIKMATVQSFTPVYEGPCTPPPPARRVSDAFIWDWASGSSSYGKDTPFTLGCYSEKAAPNTNAMYASFDGQIYTYTIGTYGGIKKYGGTSSSGVTTITVTDKPNTDVSKLNAPDINGMYTSTFYNRKEEEADCPPNFPGNFQPYMGVGYVNTIYNTNSNRASLSSNGSVVTIECTGFRVGSFCPPPPYYNSKTGLPFSTASTTSQGRVYNAKYNTLPVAIINGPTAWWCGQFDTSTIQNADTSNYLSKAKTILKTVNGIKMATLKGFTPIYEGACIPPPSTAPEATTTLDDNVEALKFVYGGGPDFQYTGINKVWSLPGVTPAPYDDPSLPADPRKGFYIHKHYNSAYVTYNKGIDSTTGLSLLVCGTDVDVPVLQYYGPCTLPPDFINTYEGPDAWPYIYTPQQQTQTISNITNCWDPRGGFNVYKGPCVGPAGTASPVYTGGPVPTTTLSPMEPYTRGELFLPVIPQTGTIVIPEITNQMAITSEEYKTNIPANVRPLLNRVLYLLDTEQQSASLEAAANTLYISTYDGATRTALATKIHVAGQTIGDATDMVNLIQDALAPTIQNFEKNAKPIIDAKYAEVTALIERCLANLNTNLELLRARAALDSISGATAAFANPIIAGISFLTGMASLGASLYNPRQYHKDDTCWDGDLKTFQKKLDELMQSIQNEMQDTINKYLQAIHDSGLTRYQELVRTATITSTRAANAGVVNFVSRSTQGRDITNNSLNLSIDELNVQNSLAQAHVLSRGNSSSQHAPVLTYTPTGPVYTSDNEYSDVISSLMNDPYFGPIYENELRSIVQMSIKAMDTASPVHVVNPRVLVVSPGDGSVVSPPIDLNKPTDPYSINDRMTCAQQYNVANKVAMSAKNNNFISDNEGLYSVSSVRQFILGYPIYIKNTSLPVTAHTLFTLNTSYYTQRVPGGPWDGFVPGPNIEIKAPTPYDFNMLGVIYTSFYMSQSSYFQDHGCYTPTAIMDKPDQSNPGRRVALDVRDVWLMYAPYAELPDGYPLRTHTDVDQNNDFFKGDCLSYVRFLNKYPPIKNASAPMAGGLYPDTQDVHTQKSWRDTIIEYYDIQNPDANPNVIPAIPESVCQGSGQIIRGITPRETNGSIRTTQSGGQILTDNDALVLYESLKEKKQDSYVENITFKYSIYATKIANTATLIQQYADEANDYATRAEATKSDVPIKVDAAVKARAAAKQVADDAAAALNLASSVANASKTIHIVPGGNDEPLNLSLIGGGKKKNKKKKGGAPTTTLPTTIVNDDRTIILEGLDEVSKLLFSATSNLKEAKDNYAIADPVGASNDVLSKALSSVNEAIAFVTAADNYSTSTSPNKRMGKFDEYLTAAKKAISYAQYTASLGDIIQTTRMAESAKYFVMCSVNGLDGIPKSISSTTTLGSSPMSLIKMLTSPDMVDIPNTYVDKNTLQMPIDNHAADAVAAIIQAYDEYSAIYSVIGDMKNLINNAKNVIKPTGMKSTTTINGSSIYIYNPEDVFNQIIISNPEIKNDPVITLQNVTMFLQADDADSRLGDFMTLYMRPSGINTELLGYATSSVKATPTGTMVGGGKAKRRRTQKGGAETTTLPNYSNLSLGQKVFIELARAAGSAKTLSKDPYKIAKAASLLNPILLKDPVLNMANVVIAQNTVLLNENNIDAIDTDNFIPTTVASVLKKPLESTAYLADVIEKKRYQASQKTGSNDPWTVANAAAFDDPTHPTINASAVAFAQGIINAAYKRVPYNVAFNATTQNGFVNTSNVSKTKNSYAPLFTETMKISNLLKTIDPIQVANTAETTTTLGSAYDVEDYEWTQRYINSVEDKTVYYKINYARSEAQKVVEKTDPNNTDPYRIADVAMALDASITLDPVVNKYNIADAQRAINAYSNRIPSTALLSNPISPNEKVKEISKLIITAIMFVKSLNKTALLDFITLVLNPALLLKDTLTVPLSYTVEDVANVIDAVINHVNNSTTTNKQSGGNGTLTGPDGEVVTVIIPGEYAISCDSKNVCTEISTISGTDPAGYQAGVGNIFNGIMSITIDKTSEFLYVADTGNHQICQIDVKTGSTVTLAGNSSVCYATSVNGPEYISPPCNSDHGERSTFNLPTSVSMTYDNQYVIVYDETGFVRKVLTGLPGLAPKFIEDATCIETPFPIITTTTLGTTTSTRGNTTSTRGNTTSTLGDTTTTRGDTTTTLGDTTTTRGTTTSTRGTTTSTRGTTTSTLGDTTTTLGDTTTTLGDTTTTRGDTTTTRGNTTSTRGDTTTTLGDTTTTLEDTTTTLGDTTSTRGNTTTTLEDTTTTRGDTTSTRGNTTTTLEDTTTTRGDTTTTLGDTTSTRGNTTTTLEDTTTTLEDTTTTLEDTTTTRGNTTTTRARWMPPDFITAELIISTSYSYPTAITVYDNVVYMIDNNNYLILRYDIKNRRKIDDITLDDSNIGSTYPLSLIIDKSGTFYINDTNALGAIHTATADTTGTTAVYQKFINGCNKIGYSNGIIGGPCPGVGVCPNVLNSPFLNTGSYGSFAYDLSNNYIYFTDSDNNCIRKIDIGENTVSTVSPKVASLKPFRPTSNSCIPLGFYSVGDFSKQNRTQFDSTPSGNPYESFDSPAGIALDVGGEFLYVADFNASAIRQVRISDGYIRTIAGKIGEKGGDAPSISNAAIRMNGPWGIAIDDKNNIYFSDTNNGAVRKLLCDTTDSTDPFTYTWSKCYSVSTGYVDTSYQYITNLALDGQIEPRYIFVLDQDGMYSIDLNSV